MQETIQPQKKIFLQATGLLTLAVLLGYPLSYIRDLLMVRQFGATGATDAWVAASLIPDLCYKLLMFGALGASFIPVFAEYLIQKKEDEAWKAASTVINTTVLLLAAVAVAGMIGAPVLVKVLAPGFSSATYVTAVHLSRIVLPIVLFSGIMGLVAGIYRVYLRFALPAFINLITPAAVIAALVFWGKSAGIFSLAYGTLAGTFLAWAALMFFFFVRRPPYRFAIDLKQPAIKQIMTLMIPLIGADFLGKAGAAVFQIFASYMREGSITAFALAQRIFTIPILVFSSAAATTIFPILSRQHAEAATAEFKDTILLGTRLMCIVFVPASIGFIVLAEPLVRLLFQRGMFDPAATRVTAEVLAYLSLGLLAHGLAPLLSQACIAIKKSWFLFIYEVVGMCLTIPLSFIFIRIFGLTGLAVVSSLVRTAMVVFLFIVLEKKIGRFDVKVLGATLTKVLCASCGMGVAAYGVYGFLSRIIGSASLFDQVVTVGTTMAVSCGVYLALLVISGESGIKRLQGIVAGKISGSSVDG